MKNQLKFLYFIFIIVYFSVLIYVVFFARRRNGLIWSFELINIVPFRSIMDPFIDPDVPLNVGWKNILTNLIGNVIIFIPFPILLFLNFKTTVNRAIIAGILTSLTIEILQFIFRVGVPDVDDLILNTLGVLIGVYAWKITQPFLLKFRLLY